MSRKTLVLFLGLLTAVTGLTVLRHYLQGSPLLMLGASFGISLTAALLAIAWASQKRNRFLKEDETVLRSNLIDPSLRVKLSKALHKISQAAQIKMPQLSLFNDSRLSAYSYQLYPGKSYIKVSKGLVQELSLKSIVGILTHEVCHIKNRDSWKSILRFINGVFILSVTFFFIEHSTFWILPLIILSEISNLREKEYQADVQATEFTAFENIAHSLLDNYAGYLLTRQNVWQQYSESAWSVKIKKLSTALRFEFSVKAFTLFGTHPSWEKRIKYLLEYQQIAYTDKEWDIFIKKLLNYRINYGFQRSINWDKMGILGQRIKQAN